MDKYTDNSSK